MKKILLSCVLSSMLCSNAWCGDYYFVGVDCFNKGLYDKAAKNLEVAIRINPNNVNARYYLAQAYLKQKRIFDAKNQYDRILILAPDSYAATLSEKGLSLINQAGSKNNAIESIDELNQYKDNYLDYVLSDNGAIQKWTSFPINVYIESDNKKEAVKKAFEQWQSKSKGLISFKFLDSAQSAKITVDFKNKLESTSTKEKYIAGYTKPEYEGNHISGAQMHLLTVDPETNEPLPDNSIFATTLHETGHALGFIGHSPNPNDVMAPSSIEPKMELTKRDINTLNLFYRIDEKTLLARRTGTTDLKLQQALDYVKQTPDKSVGWANLGDIYYGKKMYSEAIKNYQKAISIEPDKANLYSSLGFAYRLSGDKQKASQNFQKACDLDNTNIDYLNQLVVSCMETGQKDIGRKYVNNYLKINPDKASSTDVQKLINALK